MDIFPRLPSACKNLCGGLGFFEDTIFSWLSFFETAPLLSAKPAIPKNRHSHRKIRFNYRRSQWHRLLTHAMSSVPPDSVNASNVRNMMEEEKS